MGIWDNSGICDNSGIFDFFQNFDIFDNSWIARDIIKIGEIIKIENARNVEDIVISLIVSNSQVLDVYEFPWILDLIETKYNQIWHKGQIKRFLPGQMVLCVNVCHWKLKMRVNEVQINV